MGAGVAMTAPLLTLAVLEEGIGRLSAVCQRHEPDADWHTLDDLMSRLSEATWSAGWASGCEFSFWRWIVDPTSHEHLRPSTAGQLIAIASLAAKLGCWVRWDDSDRRAQHAVRVPLDEWVLMYDAWRSKREAEAR